MYKQMMRILTKRIAAVLLLPFLLLFHAGCSLPGTSEAQNPPPQNETVRVEPDEVIDRGPVKGGNLNLFTTPPDTLNPIMTKSKYTHDMLSVMYEGLVRLDASMEPVPVLAESWSVQNGGLTWVFHLRRNILWHDSIPLQAADVVFTYESILKSKSNSIYKKNVEKISFMEAVDDYTLKVQLKQPYSFLPECMVFPILPKHYFLGEDIDTTERNMKPVGTGPYKFKELQPDSQIILTANEEWWNRDGSSTNGLKMPLLDQLTFHISGSNQEALDAFQEKDLDFLPADTNEWDKYTGRADIKIKKQITTEFDFLAFNTKKPMFADKTVRKAISHAIDKSVISELTKGKTSMSDLPILASSWHYNPKSTYNYEPELAKKLLHDGGWREGWNKLLYKRINGINTALEFELLINDNNDLRNTTALSISEQLRPLGINIKIRKVNWDGYQKLVSQRAFDAVIAGWNVPGVPDYSFAFSSKEADTGLNFAGLKSPAVDGILSNLAQETDPEKKKFLFYDLQNMLLEEMPYIGLYFKSSVVMYKNSLRGEITAQTNSLFYGIEKWYKSN